jgi:hypothetical protein
VGLSLLSCFFITKDEGVHASRCRAGEHWLHAVLFVVHPMSLASIGLMWPALHPREHTTPWWLDGVPAMPMVVAQLGLTYAFCLYQILYWNLPWARTRHAPKTP